MRFLTRSARRSIFSLLVFDFFRNFTRTGLMLAHTDNIEGVRVMLKLSNDSQTYYGQWDLWSGSPMDESPVDRGDDPPSPFRRSTGFLPPIQDLLVSRISYLSINTHSWWRLSRRDLPGFSSFACFFRFTNTRFGHVFAPSLTELGMLRKTKVKLWPQGSVKMQTSLSLATIWILSVLKASLSIARSCFSIKSSASLCR